MKELNEIFQSWTFSKEEQNDTAAVPEEVTQLAEQRLLAKKEKNFALADKLRAEITSLGYIVIDTKDGFEIR